MALIVCVECGKEFSDKAKACPNCACPIEYMIKTSTDDKTITQNCHNQNENSDLAVASNLQTPHLTHLKSDLLSYGELLDLAFSSIVPRLEKEFGNEITDIKCGSRENGDAHYYITCGTRKVGIILIVDIYPDINNVDILFGHEIDEQELYKKLKEKGYECAVVRTSISSKNRIRRERRILLKNDDYNFDYKFLRLVKECNAPKTSNEDSYIRYSLSPMPKDESWKTLAGYDYKEPEETESPDANMLLVAKDSKYTSQCNCKRIVPINGFWCDESLAEYKISEMLATRYVDMQKSKQITQLIRLIAHITNDTIDKADAIYFTLNAIDYIEGMLLSDSVPIEEQNVLTQLHGLIMCADIIDKYDLSLWNYTAINYMIYLYCTDKTALNECIDGYFSARTSDDNPLGIVAKKMATAFINNPLMFGYDQSVADEVQRLQNINSPENFSKFVEMRRSLEKDMIEFCEIHKKLMSKKIPREGRSVTVTRLTELHDAALQLERFVKNNFDESLNRENKGEIDDFIKIVSAYRSCTFTDKCIAGDRENGIEGFIERLIYLRGSKKSFNVFIRLKQLK